MNSLLLEGGDDKKMVVFIDEVCRVALGGLKLMSILRVIIVVGPSGPTGPGSPMVMMGKGMVPGDGQSHLSLVLEA